MTEGTEDGEAAELLNAPRRAKIGLAITRIGKKLDLGPIPPAAATINMGALLIDFGGAVGLGVAGNATYDFAKAAVISYLRRGRADPAASLNHDEAYAVALWAIVRNFRQNPESMKERSAQHEATGQWDFVITSKRFQYHVTIPSGRPDVNKIQVRRQET